MKQVPVAPIPHYW